MRVRGKLVVVITSLGLASVEVDHKVVFGRFVMRIIVDSLKSFNALLVVSKHTLKDWDNLSNSAVMTASNSTLSVFATSFEALCCRVQRLQHVDIFGNNYLVSSCKVARLRPDRSFR
jgi:hypothetical protein